jgi:hypothetical protein
MSVPITETMIDPRQPDLLEKKRNKAGRRLPDDVRHKRRKPTAGLEPATSSLREPQQEESETLRGTGWT